ncbi:hypothetical protein CFC21_001119 [Triticum aestivum]|uniref:Ubiquitin-like protease family profile domain-containing protein n=1 Tax=Triticum aestivum TaxID=4565 RepID=A0A3B5XWB3_WHEAT|nr:hypothetical protein CFC21_001119 [Triticum aestivum]
MKKNLKLPQTKQQMPRADAEINVDKEAVAQTVVPIVVIREPTTTKDVSAIPVEPTTITRAQQIKGKIPLSTAPPKPAKRPQKIVKFAKCTKEEQGREGVGSRHETEQRATANAAGLPSSASLVPTQAAKVPTEDTSVPTEVVIVKTSRVVQEDSTATASPKEEVFNIVSRFKPPRPPNTTLLRIRSANDAPVNVPQEDAPGLQPIRRSNSCSYHGDGYCDEPTFDLGLDDDAGHAATLAPAAQTGEANVVVIDEDELDPATANEGCVAADAGKGLAHQPDVGSPDSCHTPICGKPVVGTSSSSGLPVARRQRRVIRPRASQRSPFIDYNKNKTFNSNEAVNKLYAATMYWVRHIPGVDDENTRQANSPQPIPAIIKYGNFFITLKELVDSMKPKQWLSRVVIETGIIHIMNNLPEGSNKVVMPLRFSINLQKGIYNMNEINKKFEHKNHLDKKDLCANVNNREGGGHYWVFNINLRDGRFEVLDSNRKLEDIELMDIASTIAGAIRQLWRKHYPKQSIEHFQLIDIDVP